MRKYTCGQWQNLQKGRGGNLKLVLQYVSNCSRTGPAMVEHTSSGRKGYCLYVSLSVCLSVCLFVCLSVCPCSSVQLSTSRRTCSECTALHCNALHCTAHSYTALHCTSLHKAVLHWTLIHCNPMFFTALKCLALYTIKINTRNRIPPLPSHPHHLIN